jgi:hypothetical protein
MVIGFLLANLLEWAIRRLAHFPLSAFLDFSLICTCRPADLHGLQACPACRFEVQAYVARRRPVQPIDLGGCRPAQPVDLGGCRPVQPVDLGGCRPVQPVDLGGD